MANNVWFELWSNGLGSTLVYAGRTVAQCIAYAEKKYVGNNRTFKVIRVRGVDYDTAEVVREFSTMDCEFVANTLAAHGRNEWLNATGN